LGNFLNILVDKPGTYEKLVENPKLIETGIEEALRYDSPVQFLMRLVTENTSLHGQLIKKGEIVQVVMGSANRDPRSYDRPDEFDLERNKIHHHSFGFGIHTCIGAPLARLEARTAMGALVSRFGSMDRAEGENERVPSHLLRGFHHLWLSFNE
jgi:cytochrome P450